MAALRANTFGEALRFDMDSGTANAQSILTTTAYSSAGPWTTLAANIGTADAASMARVAAFGVTPTGQYGRPATQINLGAVDYAVAGCMGVGAPVNFVNENDYARLSFSFRIDTGFHDDLGIVIGLAAPQIPLLGILGTPGSATPTTTTVASAASTFMGVVKAGGGSTTAFSASIIDDGTASTAVPCGSAFAANIWYDVDLEFIKGSGTNVGAMVVTIGKDSPWEGNFATPFSTRIETTTVFPDADQALCPLIYFQGHSTDSITFWGGPIEFGAWRRPQN